MADNNQKSPTLWILLSTLGVLVIAVGGGLYLFSPQSKDLMGSSFFLGDSSQEVEVFDPIAWAREDAEFPPLEKEEAVPFLLEMQDPEVEVPPLLVSNKELFSSDGAQETQDTKKRDALRDSRDSSGNSVFLPLRVNSPVRIGPENKVSPNIMVSSEVRESSPIVISPEVRKSPEIRIVSEVRESPAVRDSPNTMVSSEVKVSRRTEGRGTRKTAPVEKVPPARQRRKVSGQGYWIQVGSWTSAAMAEVVRSDLSSQGLAASIHVRGVGGRLWYRVRVGAFRLEDEADFLAQRIGSLPSYKDSFVVKAPVTRRIVTAN